MVEKEDVIQIYFDEDGVEIGVEINGVAYYYDEVGKVEIQISDLKGFKVGSIPEYIRFWPVEGNTIIFNGEISSSALHPGIAYMNILDYRKYWDHKYGMGQYYNALREAIINRQVKENDVSFIEKEDDGAWINFSYKIYLDENLPINEAYIKFKHVEEELMGHAERILSREELSREVLEEEKRFSLEVILPVLNKMGFIDAKYNHGVREYGKDITFSEINKFNVRKNYAMQVKAGDISGEANSELDKIIGQIDDAFSMPYIDASSRERRYISELIIIASGRFVGNAKEKIIEKIGQKNVTFIDIDKVQELLSKYMGVKID